ncbi:MAG: alkaline phosphatase D family protein [Solirubrobacterales bacterium]|nr:alkaline phosphatase D family protein [Solirubrobacterales bacterium]
MRIDRRRFLQQAGVAAAGYALLGTEVGRAAAGDPGAGPFQHGVASGDPLADRVILWTRVTPRGPEPGPVSVRWWIAERPSRRLVAQGTAVTDATRDFTVNVDATGLKPGRAYRYGFELDGVASPEGRTRTAPQGQVDRLRLALVSCSSLPAGFFNAYARVAERDELDLVVHVGDYIYESGSAGSVGRAPEPPREIVTLGDYRTRYAQYRRDPDLQAAHAAHPWVVVWDDHESANDSYEDGAAGHQPGSEGPWEARKTAAIRAYREWMPIRWPDPDDPVRIWRELPFGDLVDLIMLDTRLYGRDQAPGTTDLNDPSSNDPSRRMLGERQEAWLKERLAASRARWRVVGNQTMISPHHYGGGLPYLPEQVTETGKLRQGGTNEGADNWGAYRVERDRLIAFLRERRIRDTIVLTGDIHTAWGADVVEDPLTLATYEPITGRGSVAVELVTTSVTSNNLGEVLPRPVVEAANALVLAGNPNVDYVDLGGHGYVVLDIGRHEARAEWWQVPTILAPSAGEKRAAVRRVRAGTNHLERVLLG